MAVCSFPELIETERLVLRRYRDGDAAGIMELVRENRAMLVRDFELQAGWQSMEDAHAFTREKQQSWEQRKEFCYGIWLGNADGQIGQVRVKNIDWKIPAAELSYFIDARCQRQGFASESIRRIARAAFEVGFQRLFVRVLKENQESLALAKKLGFQEEGLHRDAFRCGHGALHDVYYLSLLPDDYAASLTNKVALL